MRGKDPIVAITETASGEVAIISSITKPTEELSAMKVQPYEVPFKFFTKPIFQFRLGKPEPHLLVVLESPRIVGSGEFEGEFIACSNFQGSIDGSGGPVESISF